MSLRPKLGVRRTPAHHEIRDHAMKVEPRVVALLCQVDEVARRDGHFVHKQFDREAADRRLADRLRVGLRLCRLRGFDHRRHDAHTATEEKVTEMKKKIYGYLEHDSFDS